MLINALNKRQRKGEVQGKKRGKVVPRAAALRLVEYITKDH